VAGAIAQDRESCQFPFVLDEKPTGVPVGSAGERSGVRIDIPKDDVKLENRRAAGVSYLDVDSEIEWTEMKPVLAVFEEALANAKKQKK
jgi:hypothetical protein